MEHRRDDWHNSVDERLVNLNSAQGTTDVELAKLDEDMAKIDMILRGDAEEDGLIHKMREAQKEIRKFNSLLEYDSAGEPGLLRKLDALISGRTRSEKREGYFWTFFTAVAVQFLILIGLLIVNWDNIRAYVVLRQHIHEAAAIEQNTKTLRAKRTHKPKAKPATVAEETAKDLSGESQSN